MCFEASIQSPAHVQKAPEERHRMSSLTGGSFVFSSENFQDPKLPSGLTVIDVPVTAATAESLRGYGYLVEAPDDFTADKRNFEIVRWPQSGWRSLDPDTGDEAGTTEGDFEVHWVGDFYYGKNLAIATSNNIYLDGLAVPPEEASHDINDCSGDGNTIHLWMSDYHPDGAQMFWPHQPIPFVVCLGKSAQYGGPGDDVSPKDMRAFQVPVGYGVYIHPGTWHNGVYVAKQHTPATFLTRQGRVHARVSASWASEFNTLLRVPLPVQVS